VALAALPCLLALASCDIPSAAPILDTVWAVPGDSTGIPVDELLPDGLTVAPDGSGFLVEVGEIRFEETLGSVCPLCGPADGAEVPKPPFTYEFSEVVELPDDVLSATIGSGSAVMVLNNGFSFDPLNPGGDPGSIVLTLRSGSTQGEVLGSETLLGGRDTLAAGGSTTVEIELEQAAVSSLVAIVSIVSPLGDPVVIDLSETIAVEAGTDSLILAEALVVVAGRKGVIDPVVLDVAELDDSFVERIREGDLLLAASNAFGVTVETDIVISGPGFDAVEKSVTIPPGESTQEIPFTGEELRRFMGREGVLMTGEGQIVPSAPPIVVTPELEATLIGDLYLVLRLGEEGSGS
jgi:hypothetical protein